MPKLVAGRDLYGKEMGHKTFGIVRGVEMGKPVVCNEHECGASVALYRQCPVSNCGKDVAYCKAHGGDDRAFAEMTPHIQKHHDKDTQS